MRILPPLREQVISYCVEEAWMRSYFGSWGEAAYVSFSSLQVLLLQFTLRF